MPHAPANSWPDFFDIALMPQAYGALLYQVAGLPLGIAAFTWVATGVSLSIGLAILGIGLLLGFGYLLASRALVVAQSRLAASLSGLPAPSALAIPEGPGFWTRLWTLLSDPASWGAQAVLLFRMPWGIAAFTLLATLLGLSLLALLLAFLPWRELQVDPGGLVHLTGQPWDLQGDFLLPQLAGAFQQHPATARLFSGAAGVFGILTSLHLALAFTRAEAWLACILLKRRPEPKVAK